MKKTIIAQKIESICTRLQYTISDYDKRIAQPFYDKQQELRGDN